MVNPRVIWNYETVKNEALKYKSTKEWIIQSHGSYVWASKYRLVDEFSAHMIDLRKNRSFRKDNPHLFTKTTTEVKKINLPPKSRPSKTNWDDQSVKIEALKHQKRSLWSAASPSSYRYAKRNSKLFTECTKHMGPPLTGKKRTKKECIQSAKKYKTVADWKIGDSKCHNFAKKHA